MLQGYQRWKSEHLLKTLLTTIILFHLAMKHAISLGTLGYHLLIPERLLRRAAEPRYESFCHKGITVVQESDGLRMCFIQLPLSKTISFLLKFLPPILGSDKGRLVGENQKDKSWLCTVLETTHPPEPQLLGECMKVNEPITESVNDVDVESDMNGSNGSNVSAVKIISKD